MMSLYNNLEYRDLYGHESALEIIMQKKLFIKSIKKKVLEQYA